MNEYTPNRRRVLIGTAGAVTTAAVGTAVFPGFADATPATDRFPLPTGPELTVLLTGDAGTGTPAQRAVATAARSVCAERDVRMAIGLGDNIYDAGPENVYDEQFHDKFEDPNDGIDMPWLMVLGNHDTSGVIPGSGGRPSRGNHEVYYTELSRRWYMPDRYYSVAVPGADGRPVAEFFGIDTTPLSSYVLQSDPYFQWNGPFARAQRTWLQESLDASTARWKFVFAHHPFRNNGSHGNAGAYDGFQCGDYISGKHVKELYEEVVLGRAEFILGGHDHTLQILDGAPYKGTQQLVCGAAAKTGGRAGTRTNKEIWAAYDTLGFMTLTIRADRVTVDAYTVDPATATATLAHTHDRPA